MANHFWNLRYQHPPWDGMFIDSECTEQPCPWLAPEQAAGEAQWLAEVKAAWPAGYISMYVSGLAGSRITGCCDSDAESFPMSLSAPQMAAMEPHLDQVVHAAVRICFHIGTAPIHLCTRLNTSDYCMWNSTVLWTQIISIRMQWSYVRLCSNEDSSIENEDSSLEK